MATVLAVCTFDHDLTAEQLQDVARTIRVQTSAADVQVNTIDGVAPVEIPGPE